MYEYLEHFQVHKYQGYEETKKQHTNLSKNIRNPFQITMSHH